MIGERVGTAGRVVAGAGWEVAAGRLQATREASSVRISSFGEAGRWVCMR
jgi:hypothetical protein